jgi:hypothetical protein
MKGQRGSIRSRRPDTERGEQMEDGDEQFSFDRTVEIDDHPVFGDEEVVLVDVDLDTRCTAIELEEDLCAVLHDTKRRMG